MNYWWLYLPGIAIVLVSVIGSVVTSRSREKENRMGGFVKKAREVPLALETDRPDKVRDFMDDYRILYQMAEPVMDREWKEHYRQDVKRLENRLKEIEWSDWHKRAAPHLQAFRESYESLRNGSLTPQQAEQAKRKCISEWQAYYGTSLDRYRTRITPKKYFRRYMGEDYDECMDDHYKLERQLNRFIRQKKA